nr:TraX family protein [uncultured Agathobaculum sp.]
MNGKSTPELTQNQIKLIAAASMLLDHIGAELLPGVLWLRIVGRLAFPVFSFCIWEGSRRTHHPRRYLTRVLGMGLLCMAAFWMYTRRLYGNILITFMLSLCVLYAFQFWKRRHGLSGALVLLGTLVGVAALCIPVDYGFWGVLLPLFAEIAALLPAKRLPEGALSRLGFALGLIVVALRLGGVQMYSLLAVSLLFAYRGERGRYNLGRFFYWFYPLHLLAIGLVSMVL